MLDQQTLSQYFTGCEILICLEVFTWSNFSVVQSLYVLHENETEEIKLPIVILSLSFKSHCALHLMFCPGHTLEYHFNLSSQQCTLERGIQKMT